MDKRIILCDTRQKNKCHVLKEEYFKSHGIVAQSCKLYCGDYTLPADQSISVDTKANISEIESNIIHDHKRFVAECIRAADAGIKLIVLVENNCDIDNLEELAMFWVNPRLKMWKIITGKHKKGQMMNRKVSKKPPVDGAQLSKAMRTIQEKYGVEFMFCSPEEAGETIVRLLSV